MGDQNKPNPDADVCDVIKTTTHVESSAVVGVVAYALPPNKVATLMQPSLVDHAFHRGIIFTPLDLTHPLAPQFHDRPFHCILHKIYDPDWVRELLDFQSTHPSVIIIDNPNSIRRLQNRVTMLDVVDHLPPPPLGVTVGTPRQWVAVFGDGTKGKTVTKPSELRFPVIDHPPPPLGAVDHPPPPPGVPVGTPSQRVAVFKDGAEGKTVINPSELRFPVVGKPLESNGSRDSHLLSVVFTPDGLDELNPSGPLVLQEFVNHGGVLFKVYVAGNHVRCVKRASLPNLDTYQGAAVLPFSQISNLPSSKQVLQDGVELPPSDFVNHVAQSLRKALNIHLFNFDMIRDTTRTNQPDPCFLIIDINYFPGYAKVPGYESMLTDFFLDVLSSKPSQD